MLTAVDVDETLFDGSGVAAEAVAALALCDLVVAEEGGVLVDVASGAIGLGVAEAVAGFLSGKRRH